MQGRKLLLIALGASTLGLAGFTGAGAWAWRTRASAQPSAPPAGSPDTLAGLPFKPIGAGPRDELLEIGMAESLVARLSNQPGVAVR